MKYRILFWVIVIVLFVSTNLVHAQNKSVYTSLSVKACKELKAAEGEGTEYQGDCPGIAGYKLRLLEGDLRQSIDVIAPSKKTYQLKFWNISGGFSYVGDQAEWRVKGKSPVAIIVRFNVSEDPEKTDRRTSYLVIAKITKNEICVTDVLKPTRSHNFEARRAADRSAVSPCFRHDSP